MLIARDVVLIALNMWKEKNTFIYFILFFSSRKSHYDFWDKKKTENRSMLVIQKL